MLLLAIFAPAVAPFDPNFVNPVDRLEPPSSTYWFGTDDLGRDVFSRVIYGARISLLVGVTVMVGATVLGSLIGLLAGYYSRLDTLFMRVMDGLEAFPSILLAITIMATLGPATRERDRRPVGGLHPQHRPAGAGHDADEPAANIRRVRAGHRHARLPDLAALHLRELAVAADRARRRSSSRSRSSPRRRSPSSAPACRPRRRRGAASSASGQPRLQQAWWISVFAGSFLFATVLATNLIGDGLRDALDPRSRKR